MLSVSLQAFLSVSDNSCANPVKIFSLAEQSFIQSCAWEHSADVWSYPISFQICRSLLPPHTDWAVNFCTYMGSKKSLSYILLVRLRRAEVLAAVSARSGMPLENTDMWSPATSRNTEMDIQWTVCSPFCSPFIKSMLSSSPRRNNHGAADRHPASAHASLLLPCQRKKIPWWDVHRCPGTPLLTLQPPVWSKCWER